MKTIYIKQALLALLCIAGTACTNEDYQLYDTTQKDSAFIEYINDKDEIATSVSYSFGFDIATCKTYGNDIGQSTYFHS